ATARGARIWRQLRPECIKGRARPAALPFVRKGCTSMIRATRRQVLKRTVAAAAGLGLVPSLLAACTAAPAAQGGPSGAAAPASGGKTVSATIVLPGQFVESMNPYAHSVGGIYPTWKHVIEPLVDFDFDQKVVRGVL